MFQSYCTQIKMLFCLTNCPIYLLNVVSVCYLLIFNFSIRLGVAQFFSNLFWNDIHYSSKEDLNYIKNLNFPFVFFIALFLIAHGDIKTIPEPKSKNSKYFPCCHWDVQCSCT